MSVFKDEMCAASVTLVKAIIHKALQPATNMVNACMATGLFM